MTGLSSIGAWAQHNSTSVNVNVSYPDSITITLNADVSSPCDQQTSDQCKSSTGRDQPANNQAIESALDPDIYSATSSAPWHGLAQVRETKVFGGYMYVAGRTSDESRSDGHLGQSVAEGGWLFVGVDRAL